MINDKQLMEELAVLEVQQEGSSNLVSENYSSKSDFIVIQDFELYRKDLLDRERVSFIDNFMQECLYEDILLQSEVDLIASFYGIELDKNDLLEDQEGQLYADLEDLVCDFYERDETVFIKVKENEEDQFESFSENYNEEHAELEAKLQQEKATPGNINTVSKASDVRDITERMVLGLI